MSQEAMNEEGILEGVTPTEEPAGSAADPGPGPEGNDPNLQAQTDPATRPEGLPEKFQSVEELAQAYNEMGKKIRDKFNLPEGYESPDELLEEFNQLKQGTQLPDTYEVKLPEGSDGLSEDDVALFKELGLNNEQAQKAVDYIYEAVVPEIQEAKASLEKERLADTWNMDKDSPNFTDRLSSIKQWADQNLPANVTKELSSSANGVRAIFNLMQAGYERSAAPGQQSQAQPSFNMTDIQSRVNDERYWNDAAFRAETERMIQQLHKT